MYYEVISTDTRTFPQAGSRGTKARPHAAQLGSEQVIALPPVGALRLDIRHYRNYMFCNWLNISKQRARQQKYKIAILQEHKVQTVSKVYKRVQTGPNGFKIVSNG